MSEHLYPALHSYAMDNAFRRCGMLREGGFKRLGRPVQISRRRTRTLMGCVWADFVRRRKDNG